LRKTKGCVVWVSSGASLSHYGAWGAYGSSKAAANSISGHLAVEEPDIISLAIAPGVVDTSMQKTIREQGTDMLSEQRRKFIDGFNQGTLLTADQPGGLIARLVANPKPALSGGYYR
jgi:NAD(P)-dependent dehydrogenase (short-subunit alcohol dehydrogenase family)